MILICPMIDLKLTLLYLWYTSLVKRFFQVKLKYFLLSACLLRVRKECHCLKKKEKNLYLANVPLIDNCVNLKKNT